MLLFIWNALTLKDSIENYGKSNDSKINNIKFIIMCKYFSESFQFEKIFFNFISPFVKFLVIFS